MEEVKTITFAKPVQLGPASYDHVDLREPTVGELEQAYASASNAITATVTLISAVGQIPPEVVRKLSQRDFRECDAFLSAFATCPLTGSTPSQT
jgi:hypothetical protein